MAKWIPLPADKFYRQPSQLAFLDAIASRQCRICRESYLAPYQPSTDNLSGIACPRCLQIGSRLYDRLTIIAGRRFGKTKIGSIAAAREASIPNSIIWACAPTNPKLHRYVIPAFQQLIPDSWVANWNTEYLDLRLKNGSLIHFQTLEDPDQGRGQGLDCLYIDEVCELTKAHWEVIRPSLAGDTVAIFTTTPRGYDWVHNELYIPASNNVPGYWACHAKTSESANPRISADFLAREKAQMSPEMYRQEYEADFVVFQGAVYGGAIDTQTIRSPELLKQLIPEWPEIRAERQVLVGIDTGADHPFGAVKLVVTEKGIVCVGEYFYRGSREGNRSFLEHAGFLRAMAYSHGGAHVRWAVNKNDKQAAIELAQHGIPCEKAHNDVVAGTERVKSWLNARQLWFYEPLCPLTCQQLKSHRWADNYTPKTDETKVKQKVYKKEDDLADAVRYALMVWPLLPKASPPVLERDLTKLPDEMRASIERMRRIDGRYDKPAPTESAAILDFYS